MLKYGKDTGLPESYRITLAISVALLAHTLFMATFPFDIPDHQPNPVTVQVQLTPRGSTPARQSVASNSSAPIATPFSIDEPDIAEPAPNLLTTTTKQNRASAELEPQTAQTGQSAEDSKPRQKQRQESPSKTSHLSPPSLAGAQTRQASDFEELEKRPTKDTDEKSYIAQLAAHIGERGKAYFKSVSDDESGFNVEVELKLMRSGTLVEARISKSSGYRVVDEEAYRAALLASPYPEPPGKASGARKFRVELRYGPRSK